MRHLFIIVEVFVFIPCKYLGIFILYTFELLLQTFMGVELSFADTGELSRNLGIQIQLC